MPPWIDGALYPDRDVPETLDSLAERVDFLARLCGAWDFGLLPDSETVAEIRRPGWRQAVESCRLLTSPSYHLLRRWHHLAAVALPGPGAGLHPRRPQPRARLKASGADLLPESIARFPGRAERRRGTRGQAGPPVSAGAAGDRRRRGCPGASACSGLPTG